MNSLKYLFTLLFLFLSMYGFSSDSLKITDIEKNDYDVVVIGKQVWMQENLRTSTYRNGDSILHAPNNADWGGLQKGAWCMVENSNSQCEIYGKLYNHYAVSDPRGICPKGWKVPSLEDFDVLAQFLGGEAVAGGKLKDVGMTCSKIGLHKKV